MFFSKRIYFKILLHILLILLTAGVGIWLVISRTGYIIGCMLFLVSLLQIAGLAHQLNRFNRKIRLFFDSVQDRENMLYFPELNVSKEQAELNRSLNRLYAMFASTKAENKKQEHFYHTLLEEIPTGVLAWNGSGKIILANSAAFSLLKCSHIYDRMQLEFLLGTAGIRERLSISRKEMKLEQQTITLLSIKDISDELSDKESESWSKLTHVLTHEIMNTIAPIISLSQTLSSNPAHEKRTTRGLTIIQAQSQRLMEFTQSFRHLSYLPQPEMKKFSLNGLLRNLEGLLHSDFQAGGIEFILECPPADIIYVGDENQLSQVFLNLLKNSMQAIEGQEVKHISIHVEQTGGKLLIDIKDNGPGIPQELWEEIFIPFFTTKTEGTGIGLSLCKQIIRRHKGHLFIKQSNLGETVLRMDLPMESFHSHER